MARRLNSAALEVLEFVNEVLVGAEIQKQVTRQYSCQTCALLQTRKELKGTY
jgi:hypothetical protein